MKKYQLFIDGKWTDSLSGETFETINPGTGEVHALVSQGGEEDLNHAVKAARKAFESGPWATMSPSDRGRLLYKAAQKMWENSDFLAEVESKDNGLPINETKHIALPSTIDVLEFYAGLANKVQGDTLASPHNRFNYTLKEPLGVIGAIVPWNFPLMLTMWKLAPALAAGNTIVIKPAKETSTSILELAKLFQEVGIPDGVINIVPGPGSTVGSGLASHPDVDKIAFTGSTDTGRLIMQAATKNLKPVSLELGGKSPNIVFDDATLEDAVNGAMFGIYFAQGQVCASGSRLFVQESIYDKFMDLFASKVQSIRVGNPLEATTQMGPQVSAQQLKTIEKYVAVGLEEGAELVTGGQRGKKNGYYFTPTIFGDVTNEMTIAREEIFGPVVSVIRFKDEEDALRQANDTIYGLASGIWTNDLKRAHRMARGIQAGTVYVNTYSMLDSTTPFGGMKQSGFGRELGVQAMDMYTHSKSVWIDLGEKGLNWYGG
ncbi:MULTISPECIES: aldehyde dehydrogenase family protein [Bacillaceae]|jgi:acyl-CoA reductase-like NAD-dependent aldehyde dehydrogenase|uniref:Betaine-aldehyde dehydrogenase n=2 Tax=Peribacillus simplex TaxID=1478 RepID=A0A223EJL6_9BACI|nr:MULTISPECIES: aldehyde dehydrogenase family protein [Bacillaceae]ASS95426.1 betaine-aldehyde dehydrogenase [Peribacillus simplex NBRC 15720 = DSM 1321]MEC1397988.1 aldehyde dehydrogenase family protein [Peribacillus simplex]PEZ69608.1 betaine-aldehyde dehydrogenase [Bacillus sp. AFS017274]TVX76671.1 aldehyde dehydrogenase family protein [Peribacillus simplex]CAH0264727.1 Betaine aldehyde dehydrogenase [Peribacillus simplex]